MNKLFALVAVIGYGIVASVGIAHAGGGAGTPVPEPSSIALLSLGAAALAWWQGRKK